MPTDHDPELLLLAFTWHMAREVVAADAEVAGAEVSWLRARFPAVVLREAGLVDAAGDDTPQFVELRERALVELPERLTPGEKLSLIEDLLDATSADGQLEAAEVDVVAASAAMLGLAEADWRPLLDDLIGSGRIVVDR